MPRIIQGNANRVNTQDLSRVTYDYDYPDGLDLRPDSKLSNRIVDEVLARAREAYDVVSERHSSWLHMDKVLKAYKWVDEEEEKVREKDPRKPVSIVFPYTYAIKETLVTYLISSLLQTPVFSYEGVGPDDTIGAILLEQKVQMDCIKTKVALSLHTMFSDAVSYGIGVATPGWDIRRGTSYRTVDKGMMGRLGRFIGRSSEQISEPNAILYEGNSLTTIDPYLVLPDPNVSVHEIQKGDFYGWVEETSLIQVLHSEQSDEDMFNAKYLKHLYTRRSTFTSDNDRVMRSREGDSTSSVIDFVDNIHMYINLIPKDWELSESEYPEKWLFVVSADSIVLKAKPLGLNHGMFPIVTAAPDFDGYSALPLSRLELLQGLQTTIDWLFNSHIANVRKAINNTLIVDPYMINMKDLRTNEPAKLVRTRKPAWGKGVSKAIYQLQIQDITRQHIADTSWIVNWMNQVSGVDESMMGSLRQGGPERLTGTEFQGTRQSAMSRLNKMASVISSMAMQDLGYFFASHTQQLMSQDTFVKISGDQQEMLIQEYGKIRNNRVNVSPADLHVDFDIVVRDGGAAGNGDAQVWLQLFNILMSNPETTRNFDTTRIFKHIAREMGAKNVNDFVRQGGDITPQMLSDDEVQKQVQAGNMVPLS